MAKANGRVVQILGGVVDVAFPQGELPNVYEAIEVEREEKEPLVLEVQKHLGDNWVRTVAMDSTDGLQRGVPAKATGAPIMVPVGPSTLGRIFNVLGNAVDGKGAVQSEQRYPIHRLAPSFDQQATSIQVFE
ncbi:MAG: F0F1 ATP synthase subunit beta, partial [Chloroflexi bacterium]